VVEVEAVAELRVVPLLLYHLRPDLDRPARAAPPSVPAARVELTMQEMIQVRWATQLAVEIQQRPVRMRSVLQVPADPRPVETEQAEAQRVGLR
jgi:hypothetical protein